ncbi:hypothetical protein Tco_1070133 [Tanacetum coccineum]|uniref:Uncharacterized protein n=1 Tax=Tanacetum coccineum TaxID=301880 RepID=A0ABQ5HKK5_9ASTR
MLTAPAPAPALALALATATATCRQTYPKSKCFVGLISMAAGISTTYLIAAMAEVIGLAGKGGVVQLFHLTLPPTDTHAATLFDAANLFIAAVHDVWRWKIDLLRILAGRPIRLFGEGGVGGMVVVLLRKGGCKMMVQHMVEIVYGEVLGAHGLRGNIKTKSYYMEDKREICNVVLCIELFGNSVEDEMSALIIELRKIDLLRILAGRPIRFAAMADGSFFPLADRNKPLNVSFDIHD